MNTQCNPAETELQIRGWGQFFLKRLDRLVRLHPEANPQFNASRVLHRAIYATYLDCLELGLREEAEEILVRNKQREN